MATEYLTIAAFKSLTVIPSAYVDEVETTHAGFVDAQLSHWSRWIDARLRKRYKVPFPAHNSDPPTPATVQGWLARVVTYQILLKRGIDPSDLQVEMIKEERDNALSEILEAANSENGWFDLPERDSADPSAVAKTGPLSYSEASPYVFGDVQRESATNEDRNGRGRKRG